MGSVGYIDTCGTVTYTHSLNEKDHLGDIGLDGRIRLK
jgi:hypothetical protein